MKPLQLLLSFLLLSAVCFSQTKPKPSKPLPQGLKFEHITLAQVLLKAQKTNQLIFMDVSASWCGPCKKMKKEVFPLGTVGKAYASFINLEIDGDTPEGEEITERYHVEAYPTFLFLNKEGEIVYSSVGYAEKEEFIDLTHKVREAQKIKENLPAWFEVYNAGKDTNSLIRAATETWKIVAERALLEQKPIVVELYDSGKMAMQIAYTLANNEEVAAKLNDDALFYRTDIHSKTGIQLCTQFGLTAQPCIIILNENQLVAKTGPEHTDLNVAEFLDEQLDEAKNLNGYDALVSQYLKGGRSQRLLERLIEKRSLNETDDDCDHLVKEWLGFIPRDSVLTESVLKKAAKFSVSLTHPLTDSLVKAFRNQTVYSLTTRLAVFNRLVQTLDTEEFKSDDNDARVKWEKTLRNLLGDSLSTVTLLAYAKEADLNKGDTVAYLVKAGQWADLVIQKKQIYSWPTELLLRYIKELEALALAKGVNYEDFLQSEQKTNPELIESLIHAYSYVRTKEPYFQREVYKGMNSLA